MTGEVERSDDRVIVLRRVRVRYRLRVDAEPDEETKAKIERAVAHHRRRCPVARTLEGCVEVSTELETVM